MRYLILPLIFCAAPALAAPVCENEGIPTSGGAGGGCPIRSEEKFCNGLEECKHFCCCACTFDSSAWGNASCPNSPDAGRDAASLNLTTLQSLTYVRVRGGLQATAAAQQGLEALDRVIPAYQEEYPDLGNFTVSVKNCYRSAHHDTEKVCGLVFKKMHVEQSDTQSDAKKAEWDRNARNIWGLTWPGETPHSRGEACDLVLVDQNGQDCFGYAFVDGQPTCSIPRQEALDLLDAMMTSADVGAVRLKFESWHYEWGSSYTACRCSSLEDCQEAGAPTGSPRQCRG